MSTENPNHWPTPDEIAERCAAIRAGWSDEVRLKRMRPDLRPLQWVCPTASLKQFQNTLEGTTNASDN